MQVAVENDRHLMRGARVTNVGSDRSQLATMARRAKALPLGEKLDAMLIGATQPRAAAAAGDGFACDTRWERHVLPLGRASGNDLGIK